MVKKITKTDKLKIRRLLTQMAKEHSENIEAMQGGWTAFPSFKISKGKVTAVRTWHTEEPFQSGETADIFKIIRNIKGVITELAEFKIGIY